jgi:hypothetical protein
MVYDVWLMATVYRLPSTRIASIMVRNAQEMPDALRLAFLQAGEIEEFNKSYLS